MKKIILVVNALYVLILLSSCQKMPPSQIVHPDSSTPAIEWTRDEQAQGFVIRTLRTTEEASYHVVRLRGAEKPHTHDLHDLVVFMTKGKVIFHLGDHTVNAKAGDVIEIPRGIPHWAENISEGASEAYLIFTPPFDNKDTQPVKEG